MIFCIIFCQDGDIANLPCKNVKMPELGCYVEVVNEVDNYAVRCVERVCDHVDANLFVDKNAMQMGIISLPKESK